MRRREFIMLLGSAATWPLMARAQQPVAPVFSILLVFSQEAGRTFTEPLRAYMQAPGYVEGRNIAFDVRYADGKAERLPALAAELVAQRPPVNIASGLMAPSCAGPGKRLRQHNDATLNPIRRTRAPPHGGMMSLAGRWMR